MTTWAGCAAMRETITDSTNKQARLWAREGAPHGAIVVADVQTAGRGRRGHEWISAKGLGLWLSIILRPDIPATHYPLLPFAAALATADACHALTGHTAQIKWPNDVLLSGRKLSGILVEREGNAAIMGIGINVAQQPHDFPPELSAKATSLRMATGRCYPLPAVEAALLDAIENRIDNFTFLPEYKARCITIGAQVQVVEPTQTYTGTAEDMDDTGALLVQDDTGTLRRVLAGDVSVRGLMGYV